MKTLVVLFCLLWSEIESKGIGEGCSLPVNKFPKYEPLIIIDKKLALPSDNGRVVIPSNSDVSISCPGRSNSLEAFRGKNDVNGECRGNEMVELQGQSYAVQQLGCVKSISGNLLVKAGKCGGNAGGKYMELGFYAQVKLWFPMIQICHNSDTSSSLYAQHTLYGGSLKSSERRENRPGFQEGGQYETFAADTAYKQTSQMATLTTTLGSRKLAEQYLKDTFLSRGHLAPNADFILDAYQDLSFFYVNTAPQWQSINAGNWVSLEKMIRRHAEKQSVDLTIVTGTYGILKLRDNAGVPQEIYLHGNNTHKRLPVPAVFWKVVYEPITQAAIAFVSINNGFLSHVSPADLLCADVCNKYGWKPSGGDWHNIVTGYIYCCEVADLRQVVSYVPRLKIKKVLAFDGQSAPKGLNGRMLSGPEGVPTNGKIADDANTNTIKRRQAEPSKVDTMVKFVETMSRLFRRMYNN